MYVHGRHSSDAKSIIPFFLPLSLSFRPHILLRVCNSLSDRRRHYCHNGDNTVRKKKRKTGRWPRLRSFSSFPLLSRHSGHAREGALLPETGTILLRRRLLEVSFTRQHWRGAGKRRAAGSRRAPRLVPCFLALAQNVARRLSDGRGSKRSKNCAG